MKFKNRNLIGNDEIREVNKVLKSANYRHLLQKKGQNIMEEKYVKKFEFH